MKRDWDLYRAILIQAEQNNSAFIWPAAPLLGHSISDVVGHMRLLQDAGYIEAEFDPTNDCHAFIRRITHSGYDFLEASRQKTLWEKAKHQVMSVGAPLTLEVLKTALEQLAKGLLKYPE